MKHTKNVIIPGIVRIRPVAGRIVTSIKKLVGDHPFCFKEVGRAGNVFPGFFSFLFINWYECGSVFIYNNMNAKMSI